MAVSELIGELMKAGHAPIEKRAITNLGVLNEAYDYAKPSSFSRGMRIDIGNIAILLISGTASIDESGVSVHVGDFRAQMRRTYKNITELLKAAGGRESELSPEHYIAVSDRDVLLRLQNNLKARLLQAQHHERALTVIETMLMLAPDLAELWREAGMLHRHLGNMRAAGAALEQYVVRAPDGLARHQAAAILQQLRAQLN